MPYIDNTDLPEALKNHLPLHAQDIYREAYNHAWIQYKDPRKRKNPKERLEVVCHKVAWGAVKKKYYKGRDGDWHEREEKKQELAKL